MLYNVNCEAQIPCHSPMSWTIHRF